MFWPGFAPLFRSIAAAALASAFTLILALQPAAAMELGLQLPGDPAIATLISAEQALLELTNADRAANGLGPLEFDPETLVIARERAANQLDAPSLSHYNADGDLAFVKLLASAQVNCELAGENLARSDASDAAVTQRVESALMLSPLHRKNILERTFTRVAIGAATDASGRITFAEVYRN